MQKEQYGRAFYRQISQNDSIYSELYEIFYDAKCNANGITDWALQQGRYALQENNEGKGLVFNKNFTLLNRVFPTIQPEIDLFFTPISPAVEGQYDLSTEKIIQNGTQEIAVIRFTPKWDIVGKTPSMEGQVYIDMATYDILKLSGKFASNELKVIAFKGEGTVDNYVLHYESSFKQAETGALLLDYIRTEQVFDVVYTDRPSKKVSTRSLLNFYEYYAPDNPQKRLGGRLNFNKSDVEVIDKKAYDAEFWRENPIVKRTPIEEGVIAAFEKGRQFGSIFLNDRNQVSFIPDIDADPFVQKLLTQLAEKAPIQEKVYLHLDKPYYASGESVWFKAYLVDASFHRPLNASASLWVDIIDSKGAVVTHQLLAIQGDGYAYGDVKIDSRFLAGKYRIRAYTDRMTHFDPAFFFSQEIDIFDQQADWAKQEKGDDFELQFFPEGGDLVADLSSQLAFKAVDEQGNGIEVTGTIKDDKGVAVGKIEAFHQGMNSLIFQPKSGRKYHAEVSYKGKTKRFDLPVILKEGYAMSVRNKPDKNISIRILASPEKENTEVYLIGQVRGYVYYKGKGTLKNRLLDFELPKQLFPSGILQLTLMDAQGRAYAERLTFIMEDAPLQITIKPNKRSYSSRAPITLHLTVKDEHGKPVQGHFSVAVTDAVQVTLPEYPDQITNYLLLSSDLKGGVEMAGSYLDSSLPTTARRLDLLMLTNGWRRFSWQQILGTEKIGEEPPFQQGISVCGQLRDADVVKYKETDLALVSMGAGAGFHTTRANANGRFCFEDLYFQDTSYLLVQVMGQKGKTVNLEVDFDAATWPATNDHRNIEAKVEKAAVANYLAVMEKRQEEATVLNGDYVLLDEVVVLGNKISPKPAESLHGQGAADVILKMDEQYQNHPNVLSVMNGKVPGLQIIDDGFNAVIRMTGSTNDPLVLFDGLPVNQQSIAAPPVPVEEGGRENEGGLSLEGIANVAANRTEDKALYQFLRSLTPNTIDRIEVLKGANAAIYGVRGGNGVIAIYSKAPQANPQKALKGQQYPGYYTARTFYTPTYNSDKDVLQRKDRRATIYWNPAVETDQEGNAQLLFYNTDIAPSFNVVVEGLTANGQLGSAVLKWEEKVGN
ncbi:MAG: TonB-dependent receptor plug domain-containing protein [Saprospiraceae bacterium]